MKAYLRSLPPRLPRLVNHVYNGTFMSRLLSEIKQLRTNINMAAWNDAMVKNGYIDYEICQNVTIRLYADNRLSASIYFYNYEKNERLFLRRFLKPGDVFIDIGANIGLMTIEAVCAIGNRGHIYAFEPVPLTFNRLEENVKLNSFNNVTCIQAALSNSIEVMDIIIPSNGYEAWSSLGKPIMDNEYVRFKVKTTTFADFAKEHSLIGRTTMIKIDVEGWEVSVLEGARPILQRPDAPLLQVEFSDIAARNAGYTCQHLYNVLFDLGYYLYSYDADKNQFFQEMEQIEYDYKNLYAIKDTELVKARMKTCFID